MRHYEFAAQAEIDLFEMSARVAVDNEPAALDLLERVQSECDSLVDNPGLGRAREELIENLRSAPVGDYVIFYRPADYGIQVIRILHGDRDLKDPIEHWED